MKIDKIIKKIKKFFELIYWAMGVVAYLIIGLAMLLLILNYLSTKDPYPLYIVVIAAGYVIYNLKRK